MSSNDTDRNKKKKLPGWAITLIIIACLVVLLFFYRITRQLIRMRRKKLSGIEYITVTPRNKEIAFSRAQRRAERRAQNALKLAQNKKTRNFQQKYKSYINNVKAENPGLSEFETNDSAASQRLSELTSKQKFNTKGYKQFIEQIPTEIKKKGLTGKRIQAFDRTINDAILKDMNQYLSKATNPTLDGAISFIENDSVQNLIRNHTGRSASSYNQLYKPFYQQALELKKKSQIKQQKQNPRSPKSFQMTNQMRNKRLPKYYDPIDYSSVQSNAF